MTTTTATHTTKETQPMTTPTNHGGDGFPGGLAEAHYLGGDGLPGRPAAAHYLGGDCI